MCNAAPIDVKPATNVASANSTVSTHEIKDSVNTVTNIDITTDALFIVLFFILFLLVLIVFAYNKFYYKLHQQQISQLMAHPNIQMSQLSRGQSQNLQPVSQIQAPVS